MARSQIIYDGIVTKRIAGVILEGKKFGTFKDACAYVELEPSKVRSRLQRNWTVEEAFELVEKKTQRKRMPSEVCGIEYGSFPDACFAYGLCTGLVSGRLKRGWTMEEAFEIVPRDIRNRFILNGIEIEGVVYESYSDACDRYGVLLTTANERMRKAKIRAFTVRGVQYSGVEEACTLFGTDVALVYVSIGLGLDTDTLFKVDS